MRRASKITKAMEQANVRATVLETRSEMLLNEAYLALVKAAKANGITVEELIEQRKRQAQKRKPRT